MTTKAYESGWRKLKKLPSVFSLRDMARQLDMDIPSARVYVHRWKKEGMVQPAGAKLGWYFNTAMDPSSPTEKLPSLLLRLYPSAVMVGHGILHAYGWSTQPSVRLQIAVNALPSKLGAEERYPQIFGAEVVYRPHEWYQQTQSWRQDKNGQAHYAFGLPSIPPELALVDLWKFRDMWMPDPDDLYVDENSHPSIIKACLSLDVDPAELFSGMQFDPGALEKELVFEEGTEFSPVSGMQ